MPRRRRLWPFFAPVALVIVLGIGWSWLWYYAASVADRTLSAWIDREAAPGRVYACGSQDICGFPFRIVSPLRAGRGRVQQQPDRHSTSGPTGVTFSADLFRPTLLNGAIAGPVTLADPGQSPVFVANWSNAPDQPAGFAAGAGSVSVTLDQAASRSCRRARQRHDFPADSVDFGGRIIAGSARNNPVIEAIRTFQRGDGADVSSFARRAAARRHRRGAARIQGLSPKPWPACFANAGLRRRHRDQSLRIERPDAIVVGTGTLTVNEHGKLDGLIEVAVAGIENIVPLLGLDQLIGQGIDRLTGGPGTSAQGLGALDRLSAGAQRRGPRGHQLQA